MIKRLLSALAIIIGLGTLAACTDDADVVSENISKDADNFKVLRRIVFYNGITESYILELIGFCNIEEDGSQLEVTCKIDDDGYQKHFLGRSDNVTYFVEQLDTSDVSPDFYKVTFKPSVVVPDPELR
jgi:hypothetical protein